MAEMDSKKLYGRAELKKYFRNGQIPSEIHYGYLIDSVIVQHDDGISKDEENGYVISPIASSKRMITFYKSMDRLEPYFFVDKDGLESPSLKFIPGTATGSEKEQDRSSVFFHQNGSVGVGKRSDSILKLEVDGFIGAKGRVGTYARGKVKADGKWHPVIEGLDNCQAFEIMARTGKKGSGKFSIMHAIALSAFGRSSSKITKTRAYYGFFWNKLNLRWRGTTHNFSLELRSNRNFGKDVEIFYNISQLWDDESFLPEDQFHKTSK
jgi:hypothetical protein